MPTGKRGLAMNIFHLLEGELKLRGGNYRQARYLATPGGKVLLARLAEAVINSTNKSVSIIVDRRPPLTYDMEKTKQWRKERDADFSSALVLLSIEEIHDEEEYVSFRTLKDRAGAKGCSLPQKFAESLVENQDVIPADWQEFKIVFPGTIWLEEKNGRRLRFVPAMRFTRNTWEIFFIWTGAMFDRTFRVLKICE